MRRFLLENRDIWLDDRGVYDDFADIIINTAGYYYESHHFDLSVTVNDRPNGRFDWLLCYVVKGVMDCKVGDEAFTVKNGYFLIPPHIPHYYTNENSAGECELYWIHFTGSKAEEIINSLGLKNNLTVEIGRKGEIIRSFERIVREMALKRNRYENIIESVTRYILSLVARAADEKLNLSNNITIDSRIYKAWEYIRVYFQDNISVKQLADISNLSVSRFSTLFKQNFGLYPLQYIQKYRVKRACELLKNTENSVTQIADICGFNDPLYFSRVFKKEMGISPTKYRGNISLEEPEFYEGTVGVHN